MKPRGIEITGYSGMNLTALSLQAKVACNLEA